MSQTSVGIQFNPSQRPGVTLALDPKDPERLLVRTRLGLGRLKVLEGAPVDSAFFPKLQAISRGAEDA